MTLSINDSSLSSSAKNSSLDNQPDLVSINNDSQDNFVNASDLDNDSVDVNDLNPDSPTSSNLNTENSDPESSTHQELDLEDEDIIEAQDGAQRPDPKITVTAISEDIVVATIENQDPKEQQPEEKLEHEHELETEAPASVPDSENQQPEEVEIKDDTAIEASSNDKNDYDKEDRQQTNTEIEKTVQLQGSSETPAPSKISSSEPSNEISAPVEVVNDTHTDESVILRNAQNTDKSREPVEAKEPLESEIEEESEQEEIKEKKEAKLESYKQFVAEQFSHQKVDYPEVRVRIEANALPSKMYFVMNILSAIIASYGLVTNSAAVVIGAMLVAMMLGPITGVALAIIDHRMPLLRKSLFTVAAGISLVILVGFVIGLLHKGQPLTNEILSRTQPTSMDLMIALAGGTAGAYAMVSPHLSVAVVGVAVATALVPPLAASGILFANGETQLGLGALLLAITNIIAIQFTNALVLWILGFRRLVDDDYKSSTYLTFLRRNAVTLCLLVGLGVYLTINLNNNAKQQAFENNIKTAINTYFIDKGNVLTNTQFDKTDEYLTIRAIIRGETTPSSYDVRQIEAIITQNIANDFTKSFSNRRANELPIKLQLRYLPVQVIESNPLTADKLDQTDATILSN